MQTAAKSELRLDDILIQKGVITSEQLEEALEEQSRTPFEKLGETLIRLELISEECLLSCIAAQFGVPFVKLERGYYDPEIFELLPKDFVEKHLVLPLFRIRETLTVAVADPLNIFVMDSLQRLSGLRIRLVIASSEEISNAIRQIGSFKKAFLVDEFVEDMQEDDIKVVEKEVEDIDRIEEVAGLSPVVRLVNFIIYKAIQEKASDIHVEPDEALLRVRYRVDGILREGMRPPLQMHAAVVSRIKIMADLDISVRRAPQDGRMQVMMENRLIDLRVSIIPTFHGEKVVIRVLDKEAMLKDLDKLGFSIEMLDEFEGVIHKPNGVVLVTGPTGSGKTTTLYSALKRINSVEHNICTVENPIEYNLKFINQIQINEKAGLTFSGSLRSLLRQDPDIIMVGEIRDTETAQIAIQASLTGHLVFSTLHTNDAFGAVTRLVNMGVEPFLLSASLTAILAQRLVRTICPRCRKEVPVTKPVEELFALHGIEVDTLYEGEGCSQCAKKGYSGRIGVYEHVVLDDRLADLIDGSPTISQLREYGREAQLKSLRNDGLRKVKEGLTTIDEVLRVSVDTY